MHACEMASLSFIAEFHCAIKSRVDMLDTAVEQVMKLVRRTPCAADDLDQVESALSEALANAIVHGNHEDPNKIVQIRVGWERSGDLLLVITDEGDGFDYSLVPDPTTRENLLSKHGRGLLLISHFMDSVDFELGGRRLIMRKRGRSAP
jgi:serine/threonine-protein kinase RsbW